MSASRSTWVSPAAQPTLATRLSAAARQAWRSYRKWYERRAAAHHLAGLDDRMLHDIGISRGEIESAVNRGHLHRRR